MLVLSRKVGEKLVIGDGVFLTVQRVAGNRVSLAIEAPDHVKIVRGELERFVDGLNGVNDKAKSGSPSLVTVECHHNVVHSLPPR
jgi:carbon storage regulator CsrA